MDRGKLSLESLTKSKLPASPVVPHRLCLSDRDIVDSVFAVDSVLLYLVKPLVGSCAALSRRIEAALEALSVLQKTRDDVWKRRLN